MASDEISALCARIAETAALPLAKARSLPAGAYISPDFYKLEEQKLFHAGWLCVAHVSEIPATGDCLALDMLNEPLVVTRDAAGGVHVLSRVCPHRNLDMFPLEDGFPRRFQAAHLVCAYHSWSFEMDGKLRGCPHMQEAAGFAKQDWPLSEVRGGVWNGFVFVNFDGGAPPLEDVYADLDDLLAPWKCEEMRIAISMDWDCAFNWKVMVENWMESYHHIGAHRATLNPIMPGQNTWTEAEHPFHVHAHLPFTAKLRAEIDALKERGAPPAGFTPIAGVSDEQSKEWGLFVGHPIFMFLTMPDRLLWYRLFPLGPDRCRLQTMTLISREAMASPDIAATLGEEVKLLRDFHLEDMEVNRAVQAGLNSRFAKQGPLSHLEEPVWLIQRHLAARLRDGWPERATRAPYYGPRAAA
ncbi:aromatic ring-hydroxylating oxygenase subunit alpha [Acidocella sp.]|uniref:aromatic ring-hydroxylating oxygenase subunit alpha n=1 Tax=Acidocella sp. TaxID=50710 RepID=UPI003D02C50A